LDIAGYNYTENRYESDHRKYPNRIIYGSENRHDMDAWKAVRDKEHIFGQFLWTGIDYLGESWKWPSGGFYSWVIGFWWIYQIKRLFTISFMGRKVSRLYRNLSSQRRRNGYLKMHGLYRTMMKDGREV
jgi:hypothetical protein